MNSHIKFEQIYIINEPVKIMDRSHVYSHSQFSLGLKLSKIKISTRQNTVTERVKTNFS